MLEFIQDNLSFFWQSAGPFFIFLWELIKNVWWVPLPFIALKLLNFCYLVYIQNKWIDTIDFTVLEIRFPQRVLRPIKAMETVFNVLWGMYDPPNKKEEYFEGKFTLGMSLEIANIEGTPHFYIRVPAAIRGMMESAIYAQYPDVEIAAVPDYTKNVPISVPNKEWDLWGCNYMPIRQDVYPIRTYHDFFEERPDVPLEEKRIDPISSLLESTSRLGEGEQVWFQILALPVAADDSDYMDRGEALVNKLVKRPEPDKETSLFEDAIKVATTLEPLKVPEKSEMTVLPPEMMLTPGERSIVEAIERKISKSGFECAIKSLYIAKRDVFFTPNKILPIAYMNQFHARNMNGVIPWKKTITKIQAPNLFTRRRLYLRKRDFFLRYIQRFTPFTPYPGGTMFLNVEELATLFHFPGIDVAATPSVSRVEIKKGAPPSALPIEKE